MADAKKTDTTTIVLGVVAVAMTAGAAFAGYKWYECHTVLVKVFTDNPTIDPTKYGIKVKPKS